MNISNLRNLSVLSILMTFFLTGKGTDAISPPEHDGKLVVLVKWGDSYKTPATDVVVEAHGYIPKYNSKKSFVLNSLQEGRYETSLPPATYDVFVSDSGSVLVCKRVRIQEGSETKWVVQLEFEPHGAT
jgi:hypothetical protein